MLKKLWPTACLKIRTAFSKSGVVTKTFAPKFCAEWSDPEVHSSHGDHFRDNFCVNVSEPCLGALSRSPVSEPCLGVLSRSPVSGPYLGALSRSPISEPYLGAPSRGPKVDPAPEKCRRHKVVRAEILCRMIRSRGPQLSRGM